MVFFHFFIVVKLWEVYLLAFDTSIPGKISLPVFIMKFGSSFLAFFDGYSDANAILVAHHCGSGLWRPMALCYFVGVVLLQWTLLGITSLATDSSNTCFFKMLHMDALAECSAMKPTDTLALATWRVVNVFRFLFEDLPQSILQTIFVLTVKRNPVMMISIFIGVCTSALAIVAATRRASAALGTNFEYLRATSNMQEALDKKDQKAYFEAYERAEKSGANLDALQEQAFEAEKVFEFQTTRPFISAEGDFTDPPVALQKSLELATPEDAYHRRRQSMNFALRVQKRRDKERRARENDDPVAVGRGSHHEGKHIWRTYDSRRQTVHFAKEAQEQREERLMALVKDGPGCCHGSRPKNPGEIPNAVCRLPPME